MILYHLKMVLNMFIMYSPSKCQEVHHVRINICVSMGILLKTELLKAKIIEMKL